MSLILEALRKSEAERRRGQAPDLLSEPLAFAPAPRASAHALPRWVLAAGGVVLAALVAWWVWPRTAATTPVATPDAPLADDPALVAGRTGVAERTGIAERTDIAKPAPPSVGESLDDAARPVEAVAGPARVGSAPMPAAATPPRPTHVADRTTPSIGTGSGRAAADPRSGSASPEVPSATTARAVATPPPPRPADIAPAATAVASRQATAPDLPAPDLPAPDLARAEPASPSPRFTSPDRLLRLADLPTEDRQQLPPLKMSMHMFGAGAAQRFAIIDGNRVGEGDRIGEALVEAIEADGVTLAWRGRRIRLPVR